jgi:hypothetical protein
MVINIVIMVPLVAGPQLLYAQYTPASDASGVSGFYGPGSYLGWQLAGAATALQYVRGGRAEGPDWAGLSATAVYTAIAAGDAVLHVARRRFDAQLDAALMACRFALLLSGVCLLYTANLFASNGSRWKGRWLWRVVYLLGAAGAAAGDLLGGSCIRLMRLRLLWVIAFGIAGLVCNDVRVVWCSLFAVHWIVSALGVAGWRPAGFGWPEDVPYDVRFAFPRSASQFGDLDQWSVLVAWGVGSGYVLMPTGLRRSIKEYWKKLV